MKLQRDSASAAVRAKLGHPVIDSDGHTLELSPILRDYMREIGGEEIAHRYDIMIREISTALPAEPGQWYSMTPEQKRDAHATHPTWWVATANTFDRATASLPKLLKERMTEIGVDYTILYPTHGLGPVGAEDAEFRRVGSRAVNTYYRDIFSGYSDVMTPAAVIPMHTPDEAMEELDHVVNVLGLKAVSLAGKVMRPVPATARAHPDRPMDGAWADTYGIDSEHNYDPVWAKCVELGVTPSFHSGSQGFGFRRSGSLFMYNQIGHFAAASDALCKSLFLGGVTRRFPTLTFAFLECGVGWACTLYSDLVSRWQKRNGEAVRRLNPSELDQDLLNTLIQEYGNDQTKEKLPELREWLARSQPHPENLDDFVACGIEEAGDIKTLFVPRFFFGCEADDPINSWAFNSQINPFGARLNAILSSDIGHWDVPDMREVLAEAYELVERDLVSVEDFRSFAFENAIRLYGATNPTFFDGTPFAASASTIISSIEPTA